MDSRSVSYTNPSRRNSSRAYQDLAFCHSYGHSSTAYLSCTMEDTAKVRLFAIFWLHSTWICPLILRDARHLRNSISCYYTFQNILISTVSRPASFHPTTYWHYWCGHFGFTLCRCVTAEWLPGDHSGRARPSGWQSPPDIFAQYRLSR